MITTGCDRIHAFSAGVGMKSAESTNSLRKELGKKTAGPKKDVKKI